MTRVFEIPLTPADQSLAITLGGVQYRLTLKWNAVAQAWFLDSADVSGALLLGGVAVVTGVNLLEPFAYIGFTGGLFASTDDNLDQPPGQTTLGRTAHIYWAARA
jgi:hypothetical protein